MSQAKTTFARIKPGERAIAPVSAQQAEDRWRVFDQLQRWPTRRIRMEFLSNAMAKASRSAG